MLRSQRSHVPCGKRIYGSAEAAKRHNYHARFRVRPYWCDECTGWHVCNQDKDRGHYDEVYRASPGERR